MAEVRGARQPRNFSAMREDRVRDMAARRFGRPFASRAAAIRELSALPVTEQHMLGKRADPSRPTRPAPYNNAKVLDRMRGGAARAPDVIKLVTAVYERPHSVIRLSQATTNIKISSPAQALTLLSRFGGTDMKRVATQAYSEIAHSYGGRIPPWPGGQVAKAKIIPIARPVPVARAAGGGSIGTAVRIGLSAYAVYAMFQAGRAMASPSGDTAPEAGTLRKTLQDVGTAALVAGGAATAVAAVGRPREIVAGRRVGRGFDGRFTTKPPTRATRAARAVATADFGAVARTAGASLAVTAVVSSLYNEIRERTDLGMAQSAAIAVAAPAGAVAGSAIAARSLAAGLRVAGAAAVPALAVLGAMQGMREDRDRFRGAVRGAVRALDPTAIVMSRGLGERLVDGVMGAPRTGLLKWEGLPSGPDWKFDPTAPFRRGQAYLDNRARALADAPPPQAPAGYVPQATQEPGRQVRQAYVTTDGRSVQATVQQIRRYEAQKVA